MKISKLILLTCVWGSIVSCEDLLDPKLTNEWSSETVWTNPDMAQAVLTQVYADLMVAPDHYDDNFLDAATDNALTRNYGSSVYRASMGAFDQQIHLEIGTICMIRYKASIYSWKKELQMM